MNSKIPFEVVNSTPACCGEEPCNEALTSEQALEPTVLDAADQPHPAAPAHAAPAQVAASLEVAKPVKKLKAKKIKGLEVESALAAVAEMVEFSQPELGAKSDSSKPTRVRKPLLAPIAENNVDQAHGEICNSDVSSTADLQPVSALAMKKAALATDVTPVAELMEVAVLETEALEEETLEDETLEDDAAFGSSQFEEFELLPQIIAAIEAAGYTVPTPIQAETIPHILAGKDIIGRAETGSGKTAAFACPLLSMIDVENKAPQVLVLAPTRELAIQVTKSFEKYGSELAGFRAVTIYGGQSYEPQNNALRRGVQVVVGTPGRVMDHLRQGSLNLSGLKTIVLDEADEMLRMGFIDDVEWILEQIPKQRQTLLFSATMPAPIQKIAQNHLHKPVNISIDTDTRTAESIQQSCILVQPRAKLDMLAQLLESEETEGVIVFVKTRDTTVGIADQLSQRGFSAAPLNGEIPQNQRERTISHLKSGRLNVLVATDVAARGLDVQRISHVINFDFPHDTEAYIHRIGRTGRAGREGTAIMFVEPKEQGKLKRLQRETNQRIDTYRQKSVDELNQMRIDKFKQKITDTLANQDVLKLFSEIVTQYHQETELSYEQIAAGLAAMAQGDSPLLLKEVFTPRSNWKTDGDNKDRGQRYQGEMATYRVEVGRNHGVGPGNIVGAITNEASLDSGSIGRIKLFDDFSTIDLPVSLSAAVIDHLKSVVVSGQPLRITRDRRSSDSSSDRGFSRNRRESGDSRRPSRPYTKSSGSDRTSSDRPKRDFDRTSSERTSSDRPKRAFDRTSSSDRPKQAFDRPVKSDRSERSEKSFDRPARSESSDRGEKRLERPAKFDRSAGGEKSFDRPKKFGKPDRSATSPRSDRFSKTRSERGPARGDKIGKTFTGPRSKPLGTESGRPSSSSPESGGGAKRSDKGQRKFIKLRGSK